ncbi:sensor histidine kinase [Streptomyces sp. NPDC001663]|uniref:sensor histidine kinase n=1 Tax=Streptomyces sp. NPDC001663 TaxID=3364597 RepID=UPI00368271ED
MSTITAGRADGDTVPAGSQELPPRKAIAITAVVLVGFFVIDGSYVWAEHPPAWERVGALSGFAGMLVLQLGHSFPRLFPFLTRYRYATWALQGLLAYLPIAVFGAAWGGMTVFLTASAVLVFPAVLGWPLFGLCAAGEIAVFYHYRLGWADTAYAAVEAVLIPLIVIGLSRMSDMIVKLHRSRAELSELAVAGERLRFARDLHDVLGFSLSAISLKCELTYRLLADASTKAQDELTEILHTSRKALADVRSVSRGYREMSLSGEADAAVSMLAAAGIRTDLHYDCGQLPGPVDTALAAALREGLTNMLRHSKAERCVIEAEVETGTVRLGLANDGVGRAARLAHSIPDGGLAALERRIEALGGSLDHGCGDDGWFRLVATVPLAEEPEPDPRSRPAHETGSPTARAVEAGHADLVPRAAAAITLAVLAGYFAAYLVVSLSFEPEAPELTGAVLCLLVILGLHLAESFHWRTPWAARWPGRPQYLALGLLAVFQFAPYLLFHQNWVGIPGFLAGSALLVLPAAAAWPALLAVIVCNDAALYAVGNAVQDIIYESAYDVICALVVFGLSRMAQLASELHWSRAEIARLAVITERLRFARDLHDLLGFSLSAITLKCELVRRLAAEKPVRAQEELTEVLQIARQALADVRIVAGGNHRMSLTTEAENASAMLAGVGIRAQVRLDCGDLPCDVDTVLATLLREGLTNVLRHSQARQCRITAERAAGAIRLSLVNDGAEGRGRPVLDSHDGGSGIGNLSTRVKAVGGRLTAGPCRDGWFELAAEVELEPVG